MKIIIVEDDEAIANLIKINLKAEGYQCIRAYDGKTGANFIEKDCMRKCGAMHIWEIPAHWIPIFSGLEGNLAGISI